MFRSVIWAACLCLIPLVITETNLICWDYCDGGDDPTGYCEDRWEMDECQNAVACRKTTWDHTDIVDRTCVYENDTGGVYPGLCYEGDFEGNDIKSCQCDDENKCNTGSLLVTSLFSVMLAWVACMLCLQ